MFKALALGGCTLIFLLTTNLLYADDNSCEIQVAVASPPISMDSSVSFNITNEAGTNKSFILPAGNPSKIISNISCSPYPYQISATMYSDPTHKIHVQPIGECTLRTGAVLLQTPNSSASVVFPHDFNCK